MYLLLRLDSILGLFTAGLTISSIGIFIAYLVYVTQWDIYGKDKVEGWLPKIKKLLIIPIIFGILLTVTPSTKEAAVIWLLPKVVNNEQVQAVPEKALKKMDQWLKDNLESKKNKTDK